MNLLLALAVLALAALATSVVWAAGVVSRSIAKIELLPHPEPTDGNPSVTFENLRNLERRLDDFSLALDEGIRRVDRAEKRVQKTVTSARRLVGQAGLEHAGIEAEYDELQPADDEAIPLGPVPPMFEEVGDDQPSGIPGLSNAALAALQRR